MSQNYLATDHSYMKDFLEGLVDTALIIGTIILVIAMILLTTISVLFTLFVGFAGSPSVYIGAIVSVILFMLTKLLTSRALFGPRGNHG